MWSLCLFFIVVYNHEVPSFLVTDTESFTYLINSLTQFIFSVLKVFWSVFLFSRTSATHLKAETMGPVWDLAGQIWVATGGSFTVQFLSLDNVGTAAREKSHSCPVSKSPLDCLVDTLALWHLEPSELSLWWDLVSGGSSLVLASWAQLLIMFISLTWVVWSFVSCLS